MPFQSHFQTDLVIKCCSPHRVFPTILLIEIVINSSGTGQVFSITGCPRRLFELEVHVMKVSGNTILITGGATGIGLALAEAFAHLGTRL